MRKRGGEYGKGEKKEGGRDEDKGEGERRR